MCPVKSSLSPSPDVSFSLSAPKGPSCRTTTASFGLGGCSLFQPDTDMDDTLQSASVFLLKLLHRTFFGRKGYEVTKLSANFEFFQIGVRFSQNCFVSEKNANRTTNECAVE